MKTMKRIALALFTVLLGCIFVGCLSSKVEVSFVVDGRVYSSREYELDEQIQMPADPTVEGKTFIGWYMDEALTQPYMEGKVTGALTLYAKFSASTVMIIVNVDGGEKIDPIKVAPGGQYTIPEAVKDGYTFLGYTYFDSTSMSEQPFPLSGTFAGTASIVITAKYSVNKYVVTFVDGTTETPVDVNHNETAVAPSTDKAGYTFQGWYTSATEQTEESKFDMTSKITGSVTLYAKYTPNTYTITVNNAQDGYVNPTAVYGETYTVVAPDRGANYDFVGFTLNGKEFPATGTYTWTTDIVIDTVWEGDGRDILFYDGANVINRIEGNYDDELASFTIPAVPNKDGYTTDGKWYTDASFETEFVATGKLTTELKLYAKYEAKSYKVTFTVYNSKGVASQVIRDVKFGEAVQNVPAVATRDAYKFDGYLCEGEPFDPTKPYAYTENVNVTEKWTKKEDAKLFEYNESGNYFKERIDFDSDWTYIYLVGHTYDFGNVSLKIKTAGGDAYATIDGGKLTPKAVTENLVVEFAPAEGEKYERTVKIVEYVQAFGIGGTNYERSWGKNTVTGELYRNETDVWQKKTNDTVMKVGRTNFIPELNINNNKALTFSSINAVLTVEADGAVTNDYSVANGAINFGESLSGKTVRIVIMPKYAVEEDHVVEYTVQLNEGVNVYTNDELKSAYGNSAITEINILRNIEVKLSADQTNTFTVDGWTITSPKNSTNFDGSTGAYERFSGNMQVNGNYFNIDGSKLPLVDNRDGNRNFNTDGMAQLVQNVHFSIFHFGTRWSASGIEISSSWDPNYDTLTMENLNIIGNGDMNASAVAYQYEGKDVLKYSGACIGIQVGTGTAYFNNVTSRFGSFALNAYAFEPVPVQGGSGEYTFATTVVATDCKFEKSWANNLYFYGFADLTLDNCYVGSANGAAIHFDQHPCPINVDSAIKIIGDTKIENWVTGEEAWFNAYNVSPAVTLVKAQVDAATRLATGGTPIMDGSEIVGAEGGTRTVVKDGKVNFVFLIKRVGDTSLWQADNIGSPTVAVDMFGKAEFDTIKFGAGDTAQALNVGNPYASFSKELMGTYMKGYVEIVNV